MLCCLAYRIVKAWHIIEETSYIDSIRRRRTLLQYCGAEGVSHHHILKKGKEDLSQCNQQQQPPCESSADSSDVEFIVSSGEGGSTEVNGMHRIRSTDREFSLSDDGVKCFPQQ